MTRDRALALHRQVQQLWEEGDFAAADAIVEQALAENSDAADHWELRGFSRQKCHDIDGAIAAFESATLLAPLTIAAQCTLADCYLLRGHQESARSILVHVATLPDCPLECLAELAANLGRLGELELALRVCRQASQREPDRDQALYATAYYMRKLRYPARLIAAVMARAHQLDPHSTVYRVALAILYRELGRGADAYRLLRELDIERVCCAHCLEHVSRIFRDAGDQSRHAECVERLSTLDA